MHGHLPVVAWFCKNDEPSTTEAVRLAMWKGNLPMVKYLMRSRALRHDPTSPDDCLLCKSWVERIDHSTLAMSSFVYDTAIAEHSSEAIIKKMMGTAIRTCSVAMLKWFQQKRIPFEIASVRRDTVSQHKYSNRRVVRFLQWLDTQASIDYGCHQAFTAKLNLKQFGTPRAPFTVMQFDVTSLFRQQAEHAKLSNCWTIVARQLEKSWVDARTQIWSRASSEFGANCQQQTRPYTIACHHIIDK